MRKGLSPLVASVLLIAITIAIAAVLANWVSTYTEDALPQTSCVGGSISFVSADYPKWTVGNSVLAVVEARYVPLRNFKFAVLMNDDSVIIYDNKNGLSLEAGTIGTIETVALDPTIEGNIRSVQILTSCSDVKTDLTALK
ncbi:MAG: hypothetical protein KJ906_02885 [Nanoarchaeota archaeon]|nr:hypothetical protein [Nanoarchaeota archaeon]